MSGRQLQCLPFRYKKPATSVRSVHTTAIRPRGYRSAGWWIPDHQPDQHPGNDPELRRLAALKYGLLPQDYKPIEETGDKETGVMHTHRFGNYPDLGRFTYDHKDPYENWSNELYRRNHGEPQHIDRWMFTPNRQTWTGLDDDELPKNWVPKMCLQWGVAFFLLWCMAHPAIWGVGVKPTMPKAYPYDFKRAWPYEDPRKYPIENYTFELASAKDSHHHH